MRQNPYDERYCKYAITLVRHTLATLAAVDVDTDNAELLDKEGLSAIARAVWRAAQG